VFACARPLLTSPFGEEPPPAGVGVSGDEKIESPKHTPAHTSSPIWGRKRGRPHSKQNQENF